MNLLIGDWQEAEQILSYSKLDNSDSLSTKGWVELRKGAGLDKDPLMKNIDNSKSYFDQALKKTPDCLEALFGLCQIGMTSSSYKYLVKRSLEKLLENNSEFIPVLLEQCKVDLYEVRFESLLEHVKDLIRQDRTNLIAYKYWSLCGFVNLGNYDIGLDKYELLTEMIEQNEPNNSEFIVDLVRMTTRICGFSTKILTISLKMIKSQNLLKYKKKETCVQNQLGDIHIFLGESIDGKVYYKQSVESNWLDFEAHLGFIKTMVILGEYDDAKESLKKFQEILSSHQLNVTGDIQAQTLLVDLQLLRKTNDAEYQIKSKYVIDDVLKYHLLNNSNLIHSFEYYTQLNPGFIINICEEYLQGIFQGTSISGLLWLPQQQQKSPEFLNFIDNPLYKISEMFLANIRKSVKVLDQLAKRINGLIPAYLLNGLAKFFLQEYKSAEICARKCLEFDVKNEQAYILILLIHWIDFNYEFCVTVIKDAIRHNLEITNNVLFMLIKGSVELNQESERSHGLETMQKCIGLINTTDLIEICNEKQLEYKIFQINNYLKAEIMVTTAKAYAVCGNYSEYRKLIDEAVESYQQKPQKVGVDLGYAEIELILGNPEKAVEILNKLIDSCDNNDPITNTTIYKKLADIYLTHFSDKRKHVSYSEKLALIYPNFENYINWGDAFMRSNEPEEAKLIYEIFQQLLNSEQTQSKNDHTVVASNCSDKFKYDILQLRIGRAAQASYNHDQALIFYEQSIDKITTTNISNQFKFDYVEQLIKTNKLEKAEEFIDKSGLVTEDEDETIDSLQKNICGLGLKIRLLRKKLDFDEIADKNFVRQTSENACIQFFSAEDKISMGNIEQYMDCLQKAYTLQQELLHRRISDSQELTLIKSEKELSGNLAQKIALAYQVLRDDIEMSIAYFGEALRHCPFEVEFLTNQAELNLEKEAYEKAKRFYFKILFYEKSDPKAIWGLGLCFIGQQEIDKGILVFEMALGISHTESTENNYSWRLDSSKNYMALAMLWLLLRLDGRLSSIKSQLLSIEESLKNPDENQLDSGYHFCKGFYAYFRKDSNEALINFHKSSQSKIYSEIAMYMMADIYLNPLQEVLFSNLPELGSNKIKHFQDSNLEFLENLLLDKSFPKTKNSEKFCNEILMSYVNMLKHSRHSDAESTLENIVNKRPRLVAGWNALALLQIMKKGNCGKKLDHTFDMIGKCGYNPIWLDENERGMMYVADYFISVNKINSAEKECLKALKHNKSSVKANEYLGLISEKLEDFEKAAEYYTKAWEIGEKFDCNLGEKIATVLMKGGKYLICVEVCNRVLELDSERVALKKNVLEKVRECLGHY